jgi:prepilin-type N-terminal cleavage/methylation domain-containing protein
MISRRTSRQPRPRPAFTLVEILVVIVLFGLLATMAMPLIRSDTPQQQMQMACDRLASLMAMCRAQAMLMGHPVQLMWQTPEESASQTVPVVMHEADPVGAPGEVQRMAASWANDPVLPKGVEIRLIERGEFNLAGLTKTRGRFNLPGEPELQTVQFHPDGTADPAVFVLSVRLPDGSEQEELQGWVVLNAVSGMAQVRKPPTPEQFEGMLRAQAALPDLQLAEKAIEVSETDASGTADLLGSSGITEDGLADFIASLGANGASAADALRGATGDGTGTASSGASAAAGGTAAAGSGRRAGTGSASGGNLPNGNRGGNASASDEDDPNNRRGGRGAGGRNAGGRSAGGRSGGGRSGG